MTNLLKKLSFLATVCLTVVLGYQADSAQFIQFNAPFNGPSTAVIDSLIRPTTKACWDGTVDGSGNLLDKTIYGRHLAPQPAASTGPTRVVSTLQLSDGNKWLGRAFNGTSQYYSLADASWMHMWSSDFTISFVLKDDSTGAGIDDILYHASATYGMYIVTDASGYISITMNKAGPLTKTITGPTTSIRDDKYHVIQIVRSSSILRVLVDGISGTPTDVSTYGADGASTLFFGTGAAYHKGDILYTRLDAEALTDAQLAKENQIFQGLLGGTTFSAAMNYSRAGTAFQTYNDGTMALRPAGMPRVGDGILVEGAGTNLFGAANQRNVDSAGWTKFKVTSSLNTKTGPDGTAYLDTLLETADDQRHILYSAVSATAATYTVHAIMQPAGRNFGGFWNDKSGDSYVIFNLLTGAVTKQDASWTSAGSNWLANGNLHVWATVVGMVSAVDYGIVISSDGTTVSYAGDITKGIAVGDMVMELGSFPTSIPDSSTGTRIADDISIPPYNLRNTLSDVLTTQPTMAVNFDQDPSGASITSTIGGYTLTKAGQPKRYQTATYGSYYQLNGSTDYLSSASNDFNPSGDFSVVLVYTPSTVAGNDAIISKTAASPDYGWSIWRSTTGYYFYRSDTGTAYRSCTVASSAVANKPSLITATFSTSTGMVCYVDALTPGTQGTLTATQNSDGQFQIGAETLSAAYSSGRLHYLAYYGSTALSQANHNSLYAALKVPGILPTEISHSSHYTKLRIRGEYRHVGLASVSVTSSIVEISGNVSDGSTDVNTNKIQLYPSSTGFYASIFPKDESTERYMGVASGITHNQWNAFDVTFDLSNLANSTGSVYKNMSTTATAMTLDATMTGSDKHINLLDTALRVGQSYNGTPNANAYIRNVIIEPLP